MNSSADEILKLSSTERNVLCELLKSERFRLTIEMQHADDPALRGGLEQRLRVIDSLIERCGPYRVSSAPITEASIR